MAGLDQGNMHFAERFLKWAWSKEIGKVVAVISWWPCLELEHQNWRDRGIGWPVIREDRHGTRGTATPIWNWVWLCNRFRREQHE